MASDDHEHVHRLVQDENAKTILLNVPLEPLVNVEVSPSVKIPKLRHPAAVGPQFSSSRSSSAARPQSTISAAKNSEQKARIRSASVGRSLSGVMEARYWGYLFENLRRAVDDLYSTCEADESIPAAKEVILVLNNYVRDMKNLIDWLKLKWAYENTPPPQRPTSLAWEVRKSSPAASKLLTPTTALTAQRIMMVAASPAKRALNFDPERKPQPGSVMSESIEEVDASPLEEAEAEVKKETENAALKEQNGPIDKKSQKSLNGKSDSEGKENADRPSTPKVLSKPKVPYATKAAASRASAAAASSSSANKQTTDRRTAASSSGLTKTSMQTAKQASTVAARTVTSAPSRLAAGNQDGVQNNTKPQRLSLVARQSLAAAAASAQGSKSANSRSRLVRSATSSAITRSRPATTSKTPTSRQLGGSTSQLERPKAANEGKREQSSNAAPFGSTSSVSSCGSSRSWADTVKGLKLRSTEAILSQAFENDEEAGWETVRSRARSRFSPSSSKSTSGRASEGETTKRAGFCYKSRYHAPTSALSLPALALLQEEELPAIDPEPKPKNPVVLEMLTETRSKEGSSESLTEATHTKRRSAPSTSSTRETSSKDAISNINEDVPSSMKDSSDSMDDEAIAENEKAIEMATEEEAKLAQEIRDTEKSEMSDVDADVKSDDAAADSSDSAFQHEEQNYESMSWADQIDLEEQLKNLKEDLLHYPGRAILIHEKLSSPARKKEPSEAFREYQQKQRNAKLRREKFQDEKAQNLCILNAKIQSVIQQKEQLLIKQRDLLECKMSRAERKRMEHLESIRKKAGEEGEKLREIAFINELQAQNMRIDLLVHKETAEVKHGVKLLEIAEERAKKIEERSAKEAEARERRRRIEEERQMNMAALKQRIKTRQERVNEEQQQQRSLREEKSREKARDREERLSSVRAAEGDRKEELQGKILQKQEDAAKRHHEKLERVRRKAFELSVQRCSTDEGVPLLHAYEPKKKCELCGVLINNEVHLQSHLRGRVHSERVSQANEGRPLSGEEVQSCNLKCIIDASVNDTDPKTLLTKERVKNMKKRVRKLKTRMAIKAAEYEKTLQMPARFDAPNRGKIGKSLKEIEKVMGSQGKGAWPNSAVATLERALGEISRSLERNNDQDKMAFFCLNGFGILSRIFHLLAEQKTMCVVPLRSIVICSKTWTFAVRGHRGNTEHVLRSNHLTTLVEILMDRLNILLPEEPLVQDLDCPKPEGLQVDSVAKSLMALLTQSFEDLAIVLKNESSKTDELCARLQDLAEFSVTIVDKLSAMHNTVQEPLDDKQEVAEFILASLQFLSSLTNVSEALQQRSAPGDPTHLLQAFQATDLAGCVSLLYGILLLGATGRDSDPVKMLPHAVQVAKATAQLLYRLFRQDLKMVQDVLGQEGISLEFRHIASHLLWYCQNHSVEKDLLHLSIILVGYFSARHADNQAIVHSGHQPNVLQQLCSLPFPYFSQLDLKRILFPTLVAVCHENEENTNILKREMSYKLLDDFVQSPDGKESHLIKLVLSS